ncbi:YgdI/YgdR family lipoprotein [Desulfovibrio sp. OttesenSCG-928-C06]|nr:YgdI/YgdR family lipoprotein [Desulfovibrio sp. OttesenSCG-928-C06]
MSKIIATILVSATMILAGCAASPRYVVVTADYNIHIANTQPVIDADADTVSFYDKSSQKVTLAKEELKKVTLLAE